MPDSESLTPVKLVCPLFFASIVTIFDSPCVMLTVEMFAEIVKSGFGIVVVVVVEVVVVDVVVVVVSSDSPESPDDTVVVVTAVVVVVTVSP